MQDTVSVNYMNTLKRDVALTSKIRLLAEWNMNRFAGPATVECIGFTDSDTDEFPLSSIVSPNRPETNGIVKARASNHSKYWLAVGDRAAEGFVQSKYDDSALAAGKRSYTVSTESKYKYWSSPTASASTSTGVIPNNYFALSSGEVAVTYTQPVWMNKVVLSFEASVVKPKRVSLMYKPDTEDATAWVAWAGEFEVNSDGVIEVYRQSNGTISTTPNLISPTQIGALKVKVVGVDRASAHLNIIEISARLQLDLSDFVLDYSVENTMSEVSMVAPLGQCSSNEASLSLDNSDGRFDNDRDTLLGGDGIPNLLLGLVDKNIKFEMDLGLLVNGVYEYTRQFTMWSDEWNAQNEIKTSVSLKDSSKFLQEIKPSAMLYQNVTTAGVAWRLCDSVGFNGYEISSDAINDNHIINYYWTDPENTVWDHLKEISEATQTAVYFDEFDVLQVMPRKAAYNIAKPVAWTFDAEAVGADATAKGRLASDNNKLADIVESTQTYDFEANVVNVKYTPTKISEMVGTIPKMEQVWAPEGDVVLRASRLIQPFSATDVLFRITPTDASVWPYEGTIQVEGEIVKYNKKGYTYRNAAGAWVWTSIGSLEEKQKLDALNPNLAFTNYFNGYFFCTGGRGQWGTVPKAHLVDISGWNSHRYRTLGGGVYSSNFGIKHNVNNGTMARTTNKTFTPNSWYVTTIGSSVDTPPVYYGTRLRFPTSGATYGAAGIALAVGTNDQGYFCELVRTKNISATDRSKWTNELVFYVRYSNGSIRRIGPNGGKGVPMEIVDGKWYDLDVKLETIGGLHTIKMGLNGLVQMQVTVPAGQGVPLGGRYGMFTRGFTSVEHEYFYANTYAVNDSFDQEGWFDRIQGGYQSGQFDREWVYGQRKVLKTGAPSPLLPYRNLVLKRHSQGTAVKALQRFLKITPDGYFGPITQSKVKSYQSSKGLTVDGIVGPKTWSMMIGRPSITTYTQRYGSLLMDEFGPVVHEVREYDVKFEKFPVIHSNLYISNDTQVICPEYNSNPFGAKFILANTARVNAIVNGEDTTTFGANNPVEQKMLVYGRLVNREEEKTVTVKDEAAVNLRGVVEVDISSSWIQSETAAKEIGEWITGNWGSGTDQVQINSIGNPLLQLGDVVAVNDPDKSMRNIFDPSIPEDPGYPAGGTWRWSHKYFVVGVNHSYDGSLKSTITLRRMKL